VPLTMKPGGRDDPPSPLPEGPMSQAFPPSTPWFDDLPTLGSWPAPQAAAKLRELGEEQVAAAVEVAGAAATGPLTAGPARAGWWPFSDRPEPAWKHTAQAFGYLAPAAPGNRPLPIRHAGNIPADPTRKGARVTVTLGQLRVAAYPGGGTHRVRGAWNTGIRPRVPLAPSPARNREIQRRCTRRGRPPLPRPGAPAGRRLPARSPGRWERQRSVQVRRPLLRHILASDHVGADTDQAPQARGTRCQNAHLSDKCGEEVVCLRAHSRPYVDHRQEVGAAPPGSGGGAGQQGRRRLP
jgi:hypothetical protein